MPPLRGKRKVDLGGEEEGGGGERRKGEQKGGVRSDQPACDNRHPFTEHLLSTSYPPGAVRVLSSSDSRERGLSGRGSFCLLAVLVAQVATPRLGSVLLRIAGP